MAVLRVNGLWGVCFDSELVFQGSVGEKGLEGKAGSDGARVSPRHGNSSSVLLYRVAYLK